MIILSFIQNIPEFLTTSFPCRLRRSEQFQRYEQVFLLADIPQKMTSITNYFWRILAFVPFIFRL